MIDSTEKLSVHDQFDIAGDLLLERGITLVVDASRNMSGGDMWCDAVDEYGERIALVCTYGERFEKLAQIKVSFDYAQPDVAQAIVEVFGKIDGCVATWSGSPASGVQVTLS